MKRKITLRFVCEDDCKDLFDWRNDSLTRQMSFNTNEIKYEDHIKWFNKTLKNSKISIFLGENNNGEKVGQVRFDRKGKFAEVNICISPLFRGKGYGTIMLRESCINYFNNFDVDAIIARIKHKNDISVKAFANAGFKYSSETEEFVEMVLNKNGY